jgi:hypothetical protein
MVGVQSNEFPRALDLGPQVRAFGIPVIVRGSHCQRLPGDAATLPVRPVTITAL